MFTVPNSVICLRQQLRVTFKVQTQIAIQENEFSRGGISDSSVHLSKVRVSTSTWTEMSCCSLDRTTGVSAMHDRSSLRLTGNIYSKQNSTLTHQPLLPPLCTAGTFEMQQLTMVLLRLTSPSLVCTSTMWAEGSRTERGCLLSRRRLPAVLGLLLSLPLC
jgi:hypothetical protein